MPELLEAVRQGVLARGGLPMILPTISLGEAFLAARQAEASAAAGLCSLS